MFKRLGALMLSISILATMAVMPASAAATETWSDNFDNATTSNIISQSGHFYVSNPANVDSGFLVTGKATNSTGNLVITEDGYNGTKGLLIQCAEGTSAYNTGLYRRTGVVTRPITLTANNEAVLRYRVKFLALPKNAGGAFVLSGATSGSYPSYTKGHYTYYDSTIGHYFHDTSNSGIKLERWYTVVSRITGAGTSKYMSLDIIDETDNTIYQSTNELTITGFTADAAFRLFPVHIRDNQFAAPEEMKVILDDVSLSVYDTTQNVGIDYNHCSIANNEEEIELNDSFEIVFDQRLNETTISTSNVTLYKAGDSSNPVGISITKKTMGGFTVTPTEELAPNTTYTLDCSGIKSFAGTSIDSTAKTINFKTVDPSRVPLQFVSAKLSGGSSFVNGATNVGLDESFTLTFDGEMLSPAANTDVMLSKSGSDDTVTVSVELFGDKKSIVVTPEKALAFNTDYVLDFSGVQSSTYGALEGATKTLSFKTVENREAVYIADDFESYRNGTLGGALNSDALVNSDDSKITVRVEDGAGYGGSRGLRAIITNGNPASNGAVVAKTQNLADGEYLYYEYKLKINANNPNKTNGLVIGGRNGWTSSLGMGRAGNYSKETGINGNYISPWNSTSYWFTYDFGTWFNVLHKIGATEQTMYIMDESGRIMMEYVFTGSRAKKMAGDVSFALIGASWTTADVCIDDVKIVRTSNHALMLKGTPTYDGETVTIAFTEPLAYAPAHDSKSSVDAATQIELYDGSTKVQAKTIRSGASTVQIIPERPLRENHTYTIVYPKQTAISTKELVAGNANFTTPKAFNIKAISTSFSISDGVVSAGDVTFTVNNTGSAINNAVAVVALYKEGRPDSLVGLKMANVAVAQGESALSVTLDKDYSDVDYAVLMLYDASFGQLMQGLRIH